MDVKYAIRLATTADIPDIVRLDSDAFSPYGTAEDAEVIAARLAVFPEAMAVVERDGSLIGYGSAEKWLADRDPALNEHPRETHHADGRIFCITAMAIISAFQRQGYGTALLHYFIELARTHGCYQIILETTHGQQFYQKQGFQIIRQREERGVTLAILSRDLRISS